MTKQSHTENEYLKPVILFSFRPGILFHGYEFVSYSSYWGCCLSAAVLIRKKKFQLTVRFVGVHKYSATVQNWCNELQADKYTHFWSHKKPQLLAYKAWSFNVLIKEWSLSNQIWHISSDPVDGKIATQLFKLLLLIRCSASS